jgi:hypothetical protein
LLDDERFFDELDDERFFDEDERCRGTFAPASRASLSPIAIACLRLVTRLPLPPDRNVPCFRSCIARSTFSDAFFPYFAMETSSL